MLPDLTLPLPASLMALLGAFRPLFSAPSFRTFCALAGGFLAQITGQRHVQLVLSEYVDHYNPHRPHRALQQDPPAGRAHPRAETTGMRILRRDRLGGLIHEYAQVA
jgi:hypothetical protein